MNDAGRSLPVRRPRLLSRIALVLAKRLPRGYWRLMHYAAVRDEALWDFAIPLRTLPGMSLRADLRETVAMPFLRHGCLPGQIGLDRLFGKLVAEGDTVFDVGANVGYTMLLFASLVGAEGKIVALEPGRRAFAGLARNAERRPTVTPVNAAASDRLGEATFYETAMSDISSLERVAGAVEFTVPTTTLDLVANTQGAPAFVKIDVEGHEPAVLRGMAGLLRSRRQPIIVFEALNSMLRDRCVEAIRELAGADARVFRVRGDGSLAADLDAPATTDYLFLPTWAEERMAGSAAEPA